MPEPLDLLEEACSQRDLLPPIIEQRATLSGSVLSIEIPGGPHIRKLVCVGNATQEQWDRVRDSVALQMVSQFHKQPVALEKP